MYEGLVIEEVLFPVTPSPPHWIIAVPYVHGHKIGKIAIFAARRYASARHYAVVCLSVCPSVTSGEPARYRYD